MQHHHPNQGVGGGGVPESESQVGSADYHMNYPQIREAGGVEHQEVGDLGVVEAASPLRSRPPAAGGSSSGNRWPRQETLALLQIRSEMDAAFRDAAPKAPLWEQVSRRLAELGYRRSAKKCKEKFENVHKYYKRTKEGRGSRQDGKSYKFFTQLEALDHHGSLPPQDALPPLIPPPPAAGPASLLNAVGISFSSDTFSSHGGDDDDDDDDDEEDLEMESADVISQQRKRKRRHGSDERMMELFEGLMNKVMEKQEHMQNKFLEVIEKREQDRMIRDEAWKRQDMARLAREHELMAQERSISAARDAAIIAFLEKITGQSINLPTTMSSPNPIVSTPPPEQSQSLHQLQEQQMQMQDISPPGGQMEAASSRWPKAEVLALIQLRSRMEFKYQDMGPKGPLWEEISAGMQKMGYNRNAKRCKEKWENINKYFKKVKDSNKKRPEDSKTCPYYHELDALYQKKLFRNISSDIIGSGSGGGGGDGASSSILGSSSGQDRQLQQDMGMTSLQLPESEVEGGSKTELQTSAAGAYSSRIGSGQGDQGNAGGPKQPEDMLEKQQKQIIGDLFDMECFKTAECSYNDDHESHTHMFQGMHETEEYNDTIHDKEFKMAYNIQLQKLNVGSSNGGQAASTSFAAMVQ